MYFFEKGKKEREYLAAVLLFWSPTLWSFFLRLGIACLLFSFAPGVLRVALCDEVEGKKDWIRPKGDEIEEGRASEILESFRCCWTEGKKTAETNVGKLRL